MSKQETPVDRNPLVLGVFLQLQAKTGNIQNFIHSGHSKKKKTAKKKQNQQNDSQCVVY